MCWRPASPAVGFCGDTGRRDCGVDLICDAIDLPPTPGYLSGGVSREGDKLMARYFRNGLCTALALTVTGGALAHHSFAMFDSEHQVKLAGTVKSFEWANPHVYIELDATGEDGSTKDYTVECANPGILNRIGWKFNMIKPGDKITVIIAPLKTGEPGGLLKQVTLPDGRKFANGAPAGKANIQ